MCVFGGGKGWLKGLGVGVGFGSQFENFSSPSLLNHDGGLMVFQFMSEKYFCSYLLGILTILKT